MRALRDVSIRTLTPIVLALVAGGGLIALLGADPFAFYSDVLRLGTQGAGLQQSITAMAPLLLIALGLIIAFRAQLWNLGSGGSYLLSAAVVAGIAPQVCATMPYGLAIVVLVVLAVLIGALLGLVPATLKAWKGTNEVITSLMMSFIAMGLANLLIRGVFKDPSISVPQTKVLALEYMLPFIPGTQIHIGVLFALALTLLGHYLLLHTSLGLQIDMLGANPRAAAHAGMNVRRVIVLVCVCSTVMFALAGLIDMLGLWGYSRAEWNPGYGDKILPFVFLARLSPLAAIPLVGLYSVLATGGVIAAQRAGVSVDVLSVLVALVLFFMVAIEFWAARAGEPVKRALGRSYLRREVRSRASAGPGAARASAATHPSDAAHPSAATRPSDAADEREGKHT